MAVLIVNNSLVNFYILILSRIEFIEKQNHVREVVTSLLLFLLTLIINTTNKSFNCAFLWTIITNNYGNVKLCTVHLSEK